MISRVITWVLRGAAVSGVLVVGWVCWTQWGAVVHGYPLYGPLLLVTVGGCVMIGLLTVRRRPRSRPAPRPAAIVGRLVLAVVVIGWIALMGWLRPHTAVEPALTAMQSDPSVTVTESATRITLTPDDADATGLFFQPGAKVDARAYAAVLRPIAEAGHPVIIAKQPLGIAFLALPAFEDVRADHPEITRWVVGGHSLGGTVAAMQADSGDADPSAPVVGLLFYASYPAGDISGTLSAEVLSVSGSRDGLATPAKITASRVNLPPDATFTVIDGAVHAFFGDYGPQSGDGTPSISHEQARTRISEQSVEFLDVLA